MEKFGVTVDLATPRFTTRSPSFNGYYNADGICLLLEALGDDLRLCRPHLRRYLQANQGNETSASEAKRAISQYERATGEPAGTVDLMLTFVEQGTAYPDDVGYGDDSFFSALEGMLARALALLHEAMMLASVSSRSSPSQSGGLP